MIKTRYVCLLLAVIVQLYAHKTAGSVTNTMIPNGVLHIIMNLACLILMVSATVGVFTPWHGSTTHGFHSTNGTHEERQANNGPSVRSTNCGAMATTYDHDTDVGWKASGFSLPSGQTMAGHLLSILSGVRISTVRCLQCGVREFARDVWGRIALALHLCVSKLTAACAEHCSNDGGSTVVPDADTMNWKPHSAYTTRNLTAAMRRMARDDAMCSTRRGTYPPPRAQRPLTTVSIVLTSIHAVSAMLLAAVNPARNVRGQRGGRNNCWTPPFMLHAILPLAAGLAIIVHFGIEHDPITPYLILAMILGETAVFYLPIPKVVPRTRKTLPGRVNVDSNSAPASVWINTTPWCHPVPPVRCDRCGCTHTVATTTNTKVVKAQSSDRADPSANRGRHRHKNMKVRRAHKLASNGMNAPAYGHRFQYFVLTMLATITGAQAVNAGSATAATVASYAAATAAAWAATALTATIAAGMVNAMDAQQQMDVEAVLDDHDSATVKIGLAEATVFDRIRELRCIYERFMFAFRNELRVTTVTNRNGQSVSTIHDRYPTVQEWIPYPNGGGHNTDDAGIRRTILRLGALLDNLASTVQARDFVRALNALDDDLRVLRKLQITMARAHGLELPPMMTIYNAFSLSIVQSSRFREPHYNLVPHPLPIYEEWKKIVQGSRLSGSHHEVGHGLGYYTTHVTVHCGLDGMRTEVDRDEYIADHYDICGQLQEFVTYRFKRAPLPTTEGANAGHGSLTRKRSAPSTCTSMLTMVASANGAGLSGSTASIQGWSCDVLVGGIGFGYIDVAVCVAILAILAMIAHWALTGRDTVTPRTVTCHPLTVCSATSCGTRGVTPPGEPPTAASSQIVNERKYPCLTPDAERIYRAGPKCSAPRVAGRDDEVHETLALVHWVQEILNADGVHVDNRQIRRIISEQRGRATLPARLGMMANSIANDYPMAGDIRRFPNIPCYSYGSGRSACTSSLATSPSLLSSQDDGAGTDDDCPPLLDAGDSDGYSTDDLPSPREGYRKDGEVECFEQDLPRNNHDILTPTACPTDEAHRAPTRASDTRITIKLIPRAVILAYLLPVAVAESFADGSLRGDVIFPTDSHGYWMVRRVLDLMDAVGDIWDTSITTGLGPAFTVFVVYILFTIACAGIRVVKRMVAINDPVTDSAYRLVSEYSARVLAQDPLYMDASVYYAVAWTVVNAFTGVLHYTWAADNFDRFTGYLITMVISQACSIVSVRNICPGTPFSWWLLVIQLGLLRVQQLMDTGGLLITYMLMLPFTWGMVTACSALCEQTNVPRSKAALLCAVPCIMAMVGHATNEYGFKLADPNATFPHPHAEYLRKAPSRSAFNHSIRASVCRAVDAVSPAAATNILNCDHTLSEVMRTPFQQDGHWCSFMVDSGAGKRSLSPFYTDFAQFTANTARSFSGISGGTTSSPASGTVHLVALDEGCRPYVYSLEDVMYAPGCSARLLATIPEAEKGHHYRSDLMVQTRADGALLPFNAHAGHWWTCGVVLPKDGDPILPASSDVPDQLRLINWTLARTIAARGGGYIDGRPAVPAADGPPDVYLTLPVNVASGKGGSIVSALTSIRPPPDAQFQYWCQDLDSPAGCNDVACHYAHSVRELAAWKASCKAAILRKGGSLQGNACAAVTRRAMQRPKRASRTVEPRDESVDPPKDQVDDVDTYRRSTDGTEPVGRPNTRSGVAGGPMPESDTAAPIAGRLRSRHSTKRKDADHESRANNDSQGVESNLPAPHGPVKKAKGSRVPPSRAAKKKGEFSTLSDPNTEIRSLRAAGKPDNVCSPEDDPSPLVPDVSDTGDAECGGGLISTAHWFSGIGCAPHQLPPAFDITCAFDHNAVATAVLLAFFPDVAISTTFDSAMKEGSTFMKVAVNARVGFASPPCTNHTINNPMRDESGSCAATVLECIAALVKVQHEIFVIEAVPGIVTADYGQLLIKIVSAVKDAGYVMTMHPLDPLLLGGCQSRARIFFVLVRNDVNRNRGPFTVPAPPTDKVPQRSVLTALDPVAEVEPMTYSGARMNDDWSRMASAGGPSSSEYNGPRVACRRPTTGGGYTIAYATDGPCAALTAKGIHIYDSRRGIERIRVLGVRESLRVQGLPTDMEDSLPVQKVDALSLIGNGTERSCILFLGMAIAKYLNVSTSEYKRKWHGGRRHENSSPHLKEARGLFFGEQPLRIASARLGFPSTRTMRTLGFKIPVDYFNHNGAMTRARRQVRTRTKRECTNGTFVVDFKGPFAPSKDGAYTSLIGFKHPSSGYVHEVYLTNQLVATVCEAFDEFSYKMKTVYSCTITTLMFDRDPSFNQAFRTHLLRNGVTPDMSGAYDHYELGSIESYWGAWRSQVAAMILHAHKDESWWAFAANMANYVLNRTPRLSNRGCISPVEWFTNETPDLSHLRVPFSPTYVVQDGVRSLDPKAAPGWFVGYPEFTRQGVWRHYMANTLKVQVSRHAIFDEEHDFITTGTPEEQAAHKLAVNVAIMEMVKKMESKESTAPHKKVKPATIVAKAIVNKEYFVCVADRIDSANDTIRTRCQRFHGLLISEVMGMQYVNPKGQHTNYRPSDAEYDLNRGWSTTSLNPPPPLGTSVSINFVASIIPGKDTMADKAALDAVHPVHEVALLPSTPVPLYPDGLPRPGDEVLNARIAKLDHDAFGALTTDDRIVLMEHMNSAAYASTTIVAELVYPGGTASYTLRPGPSPNHTVSPTIAGPASYKAAMASPQWKSWLTAIHNEIKGQFESGCWHWASLPPGKRALRNVLVLTQKLHADFTVERPKARICVDGSCEKPGEYADISAFVAQLGTFKLLCAAMVELEGQIYSGDWTQAYLFAVNTSETYMVSSQAMKPRYDSAGVRMVLRLVRALYGGKGSAGLWDACCDVWHTEYGFVRSLADPRLYVLIRGTARISMVLATDDTAIGVPSDKLYPGSMKMYRTYVRDLQAAFQKANGTSGYTDKGLSVEFIGVGVDQTTPGEIILDMTATARNIVKKHGFEGAIRCLTPAVPHIVLSERDCIKPGTEGAPDQTAYRSRVGSMLWITRCALPIAAYQTGALARMNHAPGHAHWNASSTLLRWLATCADPRLRLHRTGKPAYMYVDSDFLPNYGTVFDNRRSTTGFCAFLAGACVSHTSRRQKTIATSTAHAEYLAAFEAGRAALRIRILLADMGLPQAGATTMFEDNQSCLQMTESPCATSKMQHLDARFHWLREQVVKLKLLRLVYCPTTDQVADCLTKPLPAQAIARFHGAMSGFAPIEHPPLGVSFGEEEELRSQGLMGQSVERPTEAGATMGSTATTVPAGHERTKLPGVPKD